MPKTIQSAKNLQSDIAEDAEIGNRTSFTIRLAKSLLLDMVKDAEVGSKIGSKTRLAKNLLALVKTAEDAKVDERMGVIIK